MLIQTKQTQNRYISRQTTPITSAPSTGGYTPVPVTYADTALDPLYDTTINSVYSMPQIGGNTYTQTGGLLELLEANENAMAMARDVEVQVQAQKVLQKQNQQQQQATSLINYTLIIQIAIWVFIGYLIGRGKFIS